MWKIMLTNVFEKKSNEETVLLEIKKANDLNEPIWFSKIVENLIGRLSRSEVGRAIDRLGDHSYIKGGYGEIKPGHAGYKYHITDLGEYLLRC